jgi:ABC-type glycerol-3-phosphate transport system substrate-binding protein
MIKYPVLLLLIVCATWLLMPPVRTNLVTATEVVKAKYTLHVFPGVYMPGTTPRNVGEPLKAMRQVADRFEALYPDTKIEFVNVPAQQREWLVTQLSAGQAPDILCINVEDVWQDVHKGWYLPLDNWLDKPNPFVSPGSLGSTQWWDLFKYQAITRGKAAPNGKMYCITYDMIETGIFYNKDLFGRYGLSEPKTWNEFTHTQRVLKQHGHIPLMVSMPFISDWAVDLLFDQLYSDILPVIDLESDAKRVEYLRHYLDGDEIAFLHSRGFFTKSDPRWMEMWRILKEWRLFFSKNLSRSDSEVVRSFLTQNAAMLWASSELVNLFSRDPKMSFEWGVFYLPALGPSDSRFITTPHEMGVIGGAATQYTVTNSAFSDTQDPNTSTRVQRCIAFLQFITTPESARSITNELSCLLPNVVGVDPQPALTPFDVFLRRHTAATKWSYTFDLRFSDTLDRMLELYLNNGMEDVLFADLIERNLDIAIEKFNRREPVDYQKLERDWASRKLLRAHLTGMPND